MNPKAIRKYCALCCTNQPKEINLCPATKCPLYPFRLGKKPKNQSYTVLRAIRLKCLDCAVTSNKVKRCVFNDKLVYFCELYPYRMGKNPKRQGRGLGRRFKSK